jgi:hypothetical protein
MKLLREQINTKEAVLASGWGSGDLDNLAWASLKDDDITNVNVVCWDGDGVWDACWARGAAGVGH